MPSDLEVLILAASHLLQNQPSNIINIFNIFAMNFHVLRLQVSVWAKDKTTKSIQNIFEKYSSKNMLSTQKILRHFCKFQKNKGNYSFKGVVWKFCHHLLTLMEFLVWLSFFCRMQKNIFWRMLVTKQFWLSLTSIVWTKHLDISLLCSTE